MIKSTTPLKCLAISILLIGSGCSSEDSSDGGNDSDPGFTAVNVGKFKNTANKEEFLSKAKKAKSNVASMGSIKESFQSAGSGNGITGMSLLVQNDIDEECFETSRETKDVDGRSAEIVTESCFRQSEDGVFVSCTVTTSTFEDGQVSKKEECTGDENPDDDDDFDDDGDFDNDGDFNSEDDFGTADGFDMDFDLIANCDDAFKSFEELYSNISKSLEQTISMLENPNNMQLARNNAANDGMQLTEIPTDDRSAVAFEFKPSENSEGISMSGKLSGGADESTMLITMDYDLVMDMSKMNMGTMPAGADTQNIVIKTKQKISIAADLDNKIIEMVIDSDMENGGEQSVRVKTQGNVTVSAGTSKYITQDMKIATSGAEDISMTIALRADLIDDKTLQYTGKVSTAEESGVFKFKVVRTSNGECSVTEVENSVPKK